MENDDDKFFHLTCHIDQNLKLKIESGQFVDLERLLPKSRLQVVNEEQRMHFVNHDGATFWVPAERDNKINGIQRWDQVFRIYAAIYSKANPARSAEIWQYIHVINTAAASYAWENVMYYNFTFRQLMSERPNRSWAKTYNQLWNLAMCEPITKSSYHGPAVKSSTNSNYNDWHDRCCWRFNRGEKCKKWNCRFDHRCRNCGSWNHDSTVCPKKKSKSGSFSDFDKSDSLPHNHHKWGNGKEKDGKHKHLYKSICDGRTHRLITISIILSRFGWKNTSGDGTWGPLFWKFWFDQYNNSCKTRCIEPSTTWGWL